jgi:hypothetical protein
MDIFRDSNAIQGDQIGRIFACWVIFSQSHLVTLMLFRIEHGFNENDEVMKMF